MIISCVNTGSKGNCYLVDDGNGILALDAGCRWKDVQIACGFMTSGIEACLISHEHGDHANYCRDFNRNGIPVYSNDRTAARLLEDTGEHIRCLPTNKQKRILGGYLVIPFEVPHENITNTAFLIQFRNGERMLYMTDFEYCPFNLAKWKIDYYLIAVNRTMDIPDTAEAREHRIRGHSSLDTVKDFLRTSMTDNCKAVVACHLSGTYADEDVVQEELQKLCGKSVKVSIAHKGEKIII